MHNVISNYLYKKNCTLLGVGPMSKNCVDVSIEIADEYKFPLMLIASRRQIDSAQHGGGYVNNWTTEAFSNYVKNKSKNNNILLCRDHGGPWQNNFEKNEKYSIERAMKSAKESYLVDIKAGFKVIHIDPSEDLNGTPSIDIILDRIYELYEYCWEKAMELDKEILFEIGTEEQSGLTNTTGELDYSLSRIINFCEAKKIPKPTFVVIQSGTKVAEMKNIGAFDASLRIKNQLAVEIQVPQMINICNKYNVLMKAHNADYISNSALQSHPKLGIHAINVAPEYGVCESRSLVEILEQYSLNSLSDEFQNLSVKSNKWNKWMLPNSNASFKEKALIAGHYIFSIPEFIEIKNEASKYLSNKSIDLDGELKKNIKKSIMRYVHNLSIV